MSWGSGSSCRASPGKQRPEFKSQCSQKEGTEGKREGEKEASKEGRDGGREGRKEGKKERKRKRERKKKHEALSSNPTATKTK
jgi:hypothetical protein